MSISFVGGALDVASEADSAGYSECNTGRCEVSSRAYVCALEDCVACFVVC